MHISHWYYALSQYDHFSISALTHIAFIQDLFKTVHFSEKGTNARIREESTFMLFVDLLNSCEGTCMLVLNYMHAMWCMLKMFPYCCRWWRCWGQPLHCVKLLHRSRGTASPRFRPCHLEVLWERCWVSHSIHLCSGTHSSDQTPQQPWHVQGEVCVCFEASWRLWFVLRDLHAFPALVI